MLLHITDAKYIEDYKVEVIFNNGQKGIADLPNALYGPVFEQLKDQAIFSSFALDKELETFV